MIAAERTRLRITSPNPLSIDIRYFSSSSGLLRVEPMTVGPRETLTRDIGDVSGLPVDFDGFTRGPVAVLVTSMPMTPGNLVGDYLQVDVAAPWRALSATGARRRGHLPGAGGLRWSFRRRTSRAWGRRSSNRSSIRIIRPSVFSLRIGRILDQVRGAPFCGDDTGPCRTSCGHSGITP